MHFLPDFITWVGLKMLGEWGGGGGGSGGGGKNKGRTRKDKWNQEGWG